MKLWSHAHKVTPEPQRDSPGWDCESGELPEGTPTTADETPTPPSADETKDTQVTPEVNTQSTNARSGNWLPWQDCMLAQIINEIWPFNEPHGLPTHEAWDTVSQQLLAVTSLTTPVRRTGEACKARFKKLINWHQVCKLVCLNLCG